MTQTLQPPVVNDAVATPEISFFVNQEGQPQFALIDYKLYLLIKDQLDELLADQRAIAAYEEWQQDPSTARPWADIEAELIAEGLLDE